MTDPSAIAAAVKLIFPVGQAISKPFGPLTKAAYSNLQQALYNATQKYREKYCERHGELKVLGMSRPASLDDIYVKVRLLDRNSIRMFESLDKIEETFRTAKQRSFGQKDCVTKPGYEVANGEQYLMVLGGPGAGKSTFLRKMGMETLKFTQEEGFHHECVPVFVELKRFKELPIDIESHISDEFETCGFPKPKEFTQAALKQGKLLVLLDGLDEVPTANRSEAVKQIQDFVDRYSKNRFIASCRIAAYNQNFRRFTDVGVAEFDDEQIRDFIDNWFGKESNRSNDCWEEVTKADSVGVKELAQTPLLLTLVCLLFEKGGELPVRRATLYDRALRVLLEEWNASKELERDKPYKGLDTRAKELLLATIAFDFFEDDRLFFPRRELASTIETVLKEEILPDEKRVDGNVVLRTIEVQHGILAERSTDIYSFSHLTLQEFLAAVQISDNPSKYLKRAIKNHLFDERWKEVFLLLVGIKQADDILLAMECEIKSSITSPNIQKIIDWAEAITEESQGNYLAAAKRGVALFIYVDLSRCHSLIKHSRTLDLIDVTPYRFLSSPLVLDLCLSRTLCNDSSIRRYSRSSALTLFQNLPYKLSLSRLFRSRSFDIFSFLKLSQTLSKVYEQCHLFNQKMFSPFFNEVDSLDNQIIKEDFSIDFTFGKQKEYLSQLIDIWIIAFSLQRELIYLNHDEVNELNNYLYANQLLFDCRNAAIRLSRDVREGIVERMLTL